MKSKLKHSKLIYRKLKISDYKQFRKLFFSCFNKSVTLDFFKFRYFSDKHSFCYGAFKSSILIANIGMYSIKLNNRNKERMFSRHSSMVLKKYRGEKIFSNLSNIVKNKIIKKIRLVAMWPNKNNFSNFGLVKKKTIKTKYYLYKSSSSTSSFKQTKNIHIDELVNLKNLVKSKKSFFLKNFIYFKKRYLSYNKHEYFINKFEYQNLKSFFILKYNKDSSGINYVILDHFGSGKIRSKHFSCLVNEKKKLIFLSKRKLFKENYKLLNYFYFGIAFLKTFKLKQKKKFMQNKEIYLGDTDIFITTKELKNKISININKHD